MIKFTTEQLKQIPVFGIAGNFAEHLSQAGEDADFVKVKTADPLAPKGIFPVYLPNHSSFLGVYPLSSSVIKADFSSPINLHMEPEMCVLFKVEYDADQHIQTLHPQAFSAFNDCSIRKPNAQKISEKKNWGLECTGLAQHWQPIDSFNANTMLDNLHIASFIGRNQVVQAYGMDSPVRNYQYFYQKLLDWCVVTLNTQTDFGPLENLMSYLKDLGFPPQIIISLGATRYTPFGESGYLQPDDQIGIFVYDAQQTTEAALMDYFSQQTAQNNAQQPDACNGSGWIGLIQSVKALS